MLGHEASTTAQNYQQQGSSSQLAQDFLLGQGGAVHNLGDPSTMNNVQNDTHNQNYYQEYCRLFIANVVLTTQMKELLTEKNELLAKLQKLQKKSEDLNAQDQNDLDDKKKRFRRVAQEIDRHYKCPIENCSKSYGSEGSLNQHMKLKHPDYYLKHQDSFGGADGADLGESQLNPSEEGSSENENEDEEKE